MSCYGQRCVTREDADERYADQGTVDVGDEFSKLPVIEQLHRMEGLLEPERLNDVPQVEFKGELPVYAPHPGPTRVTLAHKGDLSCPTCQNPRCPSLRWIEPLKRYGLCPNVDYGCRLPERPAA